MKKNLFSFILILFSFLIISIAIPLPSYAAYVKRYTTIANGGMTYTGNALGLSKASSSNAPGTNGSIGTFSTTNTSLTDGTYPAGTTSNWTLNGASAQLRLPAGSSVLYAELIWGGSYNYGGQNVSASLNNAVKLTGPFFGTVNISPATATAKTLTGDYYYVRSADVTSYVKSGGAGTYTVSGVPGTEATSENNANAAGWTLAVIYENSSLPARNMTIFVGGELTSGTTSPTSSVSGFCTPGSGTISARMMVSAIEGDSNLTGDQMQFGPTSSTMSAVSGSRNPLTNFFASQINKDDGTLDTAGTFGSRNHTPGSNISGGRQSWDITNVDVSSRMQANQNTAYARGTTTGDRYIITSIGLQINVGSPIFPTAVLSVDKIQTYIGDILTYTAVLDNTAGSADALDVVYTDPLPNGTSFVSGSFTIGGIAQPSANPVSGVSLGTVAAGAKITVTYKVQVNAVPSPPANATYVSQASWTYHYQSCAGFPINSGVNVTNTTTAGTVRLVPTKSASPSGAVLPGGTVKYTITIPNSGNAASSGTTLSDPIPDGTTYVPNSTTLNGISLADVSGAMPFASARLVNSPGAVAGVIAVGASAVVEFQVTINPTPPLIITNVATIDEDGTGPAPAIVVPLTNPPVMADLAISVTDGKDSVIAGTVDTYTVIVTNNGPDNVISFNLSTVLPSTFLNPVYTASTGTYDHNTTKWTGVNLATGQDVTLTISGNVSPIATGTLAVTATVAASPGVMDNNSGNNNATDTDTLTVQADLGITKTDGKDSVTPGSNISYTITVTNNGPSGLHSITVDDTLPPLLQSPVFTPNQGVYNETNGMWTGLNLLTGQSVILTLTGIVDLSLTGNLVNTVTVNPPADVTDPIAGNNTATDTDFTGPNMTINKAVDQAAAVPGTELIYSIHYHNTGGSTANNLIVGDSVPAYTTYVAGSLRMGGGGSTYSTATPVDDAGRVSGTSITFIIPSVAKDDGVANSGNDEGILYYKVQIN